MVVMMSLSVSRLVMAGCSAKSNRFINPLPAQAEEEPADRGAAACWGLWVHGTQDPGGAEGSSRPQL